MIFAALVALSTLAPAQDGFRETRFHRVHLRNGNFVDGDLLRNEPEAVTLKVSTGELEIARDLVDRVEYVKMRSYREKPVAVAVPPAPKAVAAAPPVPAPKAVVNSPARRRAEDLLRTARHAPDERRQEIVRDLAALGGETLLGLLESLDDAGVRLAGRALRETRAMQLRAPLLDFLHSSNPVVRAEAVSTLATLGHETDLLGDPHPAVRSAALWSAELFKSRASFERAAALCADPSPEVRRQAVRTSFLLAREHELGEPLAQALAAALRGEAVDAARIEILEAVGRLQNAGVWPAVAEELKRSSADVRSAAARCLGELRAPDAAASMAEALLAETAGPVKVALAEAAGRLKSAELIDALRPRLGDPDPKVVRATADALLRISGQNHGVDPVRWSAWWSKVQGR